MTVGDPHYTLESTPPNSPTQTIVRTSAGGFPIPPWLADDTASAWIGVDSTVGQVAGPPGLYDYRTTFSLIGFDPTTASITGGWSTDNNGVMILLNGFNTGNPGTDFMQFMDGFVPFSISSGFVAGLNTLDFIVCNGGTSFDPSCPTDVTGPNATGLRVEMTGTANAVPVETPEPSTLILLGVGLAGVCARSFQRRSTDRS